MTKTRKPALNKPGRMRGAGIVSNIKGLPLGPVAQPIGSRLKGAVKPKGKG